MSRLIGEIDEFIDLEKDIRRVLSSASEEISKWDRVIIEYGLAETAEHTAQRGLAKEIGVMFEQVGILEKELERIKGEEDYITKTMLDNYALLVQRYNKEAPSKDLLKDLDNVGLCSR